MNFFEHQEIARTYSRRLIFLFILSTLAMCSIINISIALGFHYYPNFLGFQASPAFQWKFHLVSTGFTLAIIIGGFIYQSYRLSLTGGISLALDLGAKNITYEDSSLPEKKLLNVVEEMAIASGLPVPEVFVLDEDGINAFAAGLKNKDAVICVTRGAVETLSRDELQGVIAHEFSHIFNGDMGLNMKIISVIFGLMLLSAVGRFLLRPMGRSSRRDRSSGLLVIAGILLVVVGSVGTFFGRMIQAALSRQREFLADASAVQYTRNPEGIAGALKKIGGWSYEGLVEHQFADQMSHFFIVAALKSKVSGIFATHPPLVERIKRIDPRFTGHFEETKSMSGKQQAEDFVSKPGKSGAASTIPADQLLSQVGTISLPHLIFAHELVDQINLFIRSATQSPYSSRAVIFSFFLSPESSVRDQQIEFLRREHLEDLFPTMERCYEEYQKWGPHARLVLLDMCIPALKRLSPNQQTQFVKIIYHLISADSQLELFEYCLFKIIKRSLRDRKKWDKQKNRRELSSRDLNHAILHLYFWCYKLQSIKHLEPLQKALAQFKLELQELPQESSIKDLNEALNAIEQLPLKWRKQVFESCINIIQSDARTTYEEIELIRAIGSCFDIPVPPLLSESVHAA